MKALITGAGGFLGRHVVEAILARGHQVRAVIRPASSAPPAWRGRVDVLHKDLRELHAHEAMFDGVDVVVHLAATVRGSADMQFAATVVATERLVQAIAEARCPQRIVLASSYSVYDWTAASREISEGTPLEGRPFERDAYAMAKIWQERVARRASANHGWTLTVLRPGFIYGPDGPIVPGAGVLAGPVFAVVAPFARLPLTHVDNCARAFADAAEKGISGTFNIVDDERITAWRYSSTIMRAGQARFRIPIPYIVGLGAAYVARGISRLLFPRAGGKLPGVLIPRRYRARFRPLQSAANAAHAQLGWKSEPLLELGLK